MPKQHSKDSCEALKGRVISSSRLQEAIHSCVNQGHYAPDFSFALRADPAIPQGMQGLGMEAQAN